MTKAFILGVAASFFFAFTFFVSIEEHITFPEIRPLESIVFRHVSARFRLFDILTFRLL